MAGLAIAISIFADAVLDRFAFSPKAIIDEFDLRRPIYLPTATYGHFGRAPEADGGFSWERTDLAEIGADREDW